MARHTIIIRTDCASRDEARVLLDLLNRLGVRADDVRGCLFAGDATTVEMEAIT